jgi:hypothetical protein
MSVSASLVDQSVIRPELHIFWRDEELGDPYVLEIVLAYRGRHDIKTEFFQKDAPFRIDVGAPIVDLLDTASDTKGAPPPKVEAVGSELRVGPDLLRRGLTMKFAVLTDGPGAGLKCVSPLPEVDVQQEAWYPAQRDVVREARYQSWTSGLLRRVITWVVVIFVVFYVATEPSGTAGFVHAAFNGLHSVSNKLAEWVNSL